MGRPGTHRGSALGGVSVALTQLDAAALQAWLRRASALITEHADELTALDAAIGDADHGANMRRGLNAAVEALDGGSLETPEAVLKQVAMTLISKVGGASGPLYGTFFLRLASSVKGLEHLDLATLAQGVEAGVGGIVQRGKAQAGEKTMLDAWFPALKALRGGTDLAAGLLAAQAAAEAGRAATEPMLATKGRASYLGERSIGHVDPGAASTALIVRALAEVVAGGGA